MLSKVREGLETVRVQVRSACRGAFSVIAPVLLCCACDPSETKTYGEDSDAPGAIVRDVDGVTVAAPSAKLAHTRTQADIEAEAAMPEITRKRIDSLVIIAAALERYRSDAGVYPSSGGAYAAYKMSWGISKGQNWIPELVPKYLAALPRDPAESEDADGPQYLYASDGTYFKVISHYPGDCEIAVKSARVKRDPIRTQPDGTCWAYGIWSSNGERY